MPDPNLSARSTLDRRCFIERAAGGAPGLTLVPVHAVRGACQLGMIEENERLDPRLTF